MTLDDSNRATAAYFEFYRQATNKISVELEQIDRRALDVWWRRRRAWHVFLYDDRMDERHRSLWQAVEESVLRTDGHTAAALRQAAAACAELPPHLTALVEKIHRHAYRVTDEDLSSLRARHSEDELFELIVAAALGAASARLQAGLRALEEA